LYAILGNEDTVVFLTPQAFVVRADGTAYCLRSNYYRFQLDVDGQQITAMARSSEAFSEIVDVVLPPLLMANVSEIHELELRNVRRHGVASYDVPIFVHLVVQFKSLKFLTLERMTLDEDDCRVLGNISGKNLELKGCIIEDAAAETLAEVLGRNQGPTRLDYC
jgi:hypothetical protein